MSNSCPHHYIVSIALGIALTSVQVQMLRQCLRTAGEEHKLACSQQKDHLWPLISGSVGGEPFVSASMQEQANIVQQHRHRVLCVGLSGVKFVQFSFFQSITRQLSVIMENEQSLAAQSFSPRTYTHPQVHIHTHSCRRNSLPDGETQPVTQQWHPSGNPPHGM